MVSEDTPIMVRYEFDNEGILCDLVCEVTELMDNYLLDSKRGHTLFYAYLYNNMGVFSAPNFSQISFGLVRYYRR